jgi:hypothetical protein
MSEGIICFPQHTQLFNIKRENQKQKKNIETKNRNRRRKKEGKIK